MAHVVESAVAIVAVLAAIAFAADAGHALASPARTASLADAQRILAQPRHGIVAPTTLTSFARSFRRDDVEVTCVPAQARWAQLASPRVLGYVDSGDPLHVYLGPGVCASVQSAFRQPGVVSFGRAVGLQVLVHELIHTTGLTDERATETLSFQLFRSTLVRFLGYTQAHARELDAVAWNYHLGRSPAYQVPGVRTYTPWPLS